MSKPTRGIPDRVLYEMAISDINGMCIETKLDHSLTLEYMLTLPYAERLFEYIVDKGLSCQATFHSKINLATFRIMHAQCGLDYCSQCNTGIIAKFNITEEEHDHYRV